MEQEQQNFKKTLVTRTNKKTNNIQVLYCTVSLVGTKNKLKEHSRQTQCKNKKSRKTRETQNTLTEEENKCEKKSHKTKQRIMARDY